MSANGDQDCSQAGDCYRYKQFFHFIVQVGLKLICVRGLSYYANRPLAVESILPHFSDLLDIGLALRLGFR
jgi:hypothetical protein